MGKSLDDSDKIDIFKCDLEILEQIIKSMGEGERNLQSMSDFLTSYDKMRMAEDKNYIPSYKLL